jgi:hypothetical protein
MKERPQWRWDSRRGKGDRLGQAAVGSTPAVRSLRGGPVAERKIRRRSIINPRSLCMFIVELNKVNLRVKSDYFSHHGLEQ